MKPLPSLTGEPEGLAAWRASNPDDDRATGLDAKNAWNRFRDSGDAYREVLHALIDRQQGLCGYCEQRVTKNDGTLEFQDFQVEHVLAKSSGPGRVLHWRNLMLCCGGGTYPHFKEKPSRHLPGKGAEANLSCGQAKGDSEFDEGFDPRAFAWREPVVFVELDGRMRADEDACRRAGLDPMRIDGAIELLKLNCERLRVARQHVAMNIVGWFVPLLEELLRLSPGLHDSTASSMHAQMVGGRLGPDIHGHLQPFWTTERLYLGELAERWIHEHARELHFE